MGNCICDERGATVAVGKYREQFTEEVDAEDLTALLTRLERDGWTVEEVRTTRQSSNCDGIYHPGYYFVRANRWEEREVLPIRSKS